MVQDKQTQLKNYQNKNQNRDNFSQIVLFQNMMNQTKNSDKLLTNQTILISKWFLRNVNPKEDQKCRKTQFSLMTTTWLS